MSESKTDTAVDLNERDNILTDVASSVDTSETYYSTADFIQEVSRYETSDLLISAGKIDQVCSSNHFDFCVSNGRFAPDLPKPVEQFVTPQILYCNFQICHDITVQVPAVRCYTDSVHMPYDSATIKVVCSKKL